MKTFKDLKEGIVRGDKQTVHMIHGTAQTYDPKKESWAVDHATYKIKGSVFTKTALKHGLKKLKDQFPHHKEHEVTLKEEWRPAQGHKYHSKTNDELRALETVNRKGQEAASKDNAHQAHVCGVQADIARAILNHRETSRERHLKESAWDTYRRQALTEASLNVKTLSAEEIAQKHGVSLDTIKDQIAKGIKVEHEHATSDQTAEEIARDHLGERPDYYEKLDKANLEEADLKAQWNDDYRKDAYARAKNIQRTIKQQLNPKTPGLGNKAWKRADKEERENRKSTVSASLHEESVHLAQFSHHWAQFKLHDNLAHPRPGTIVYEHLPKRNQHEKEMNKHYKNLTTQQKNALRLHEETEREAASHKDRMQSTIDTNKDKTKKKEVKWRTLALADRIPTVKESFQVGDKVHVGFSTKGGAGYIGTVAKMGTREVHIHIGSDQYGKRVVKALHRLVSLAEAFQVGDKVHVGFGTKGGAGYTGTVTKMDTREVHVHIGTDRYGKREVKAPHRLVSLAEAFQVGDHVVPKIGPHKGEVHRVIHVHETGHVNITPARPGRNSYHQGAAKANPTDLEDAPGHGSKKLEEAWKDKSLTSCSAGMSFKDAIAHATKHRGKIIFGTNSQKWHSISPDDRDYYMSHASNPQDAQKAGEAQAKYLQAKWGVRSVARNIVNRKSIQELFAAAKEKKNPFAKNPDNPPADGPNAPEQETPGAPPSQPDTEKTEKKSNTPVPEKKTGKLTVKGPGADDAFQTAPVVTNLTVLPNNTGIGKR